MWLHYFGWAVKFNEWSLVFKRSTLSANCSVSTASPEGYAANLKMNILNIHFILVIGLCPDTEWLPLCYHSACLYCRSLTPPTQTPQDFPRSWLERKNTAFIAENDKTLMSTLIPQTDTASCAGWFHLTCSSEVYHHWTYTGGHSITFE